MWYRQKTAHQEHTELYNQLPHESTKNLLFHGTGEPIKGELRGGGYDSLFWTAADPAIAQMYIPKVGVKTPVHDPAWKGGEGIRADDQFWQDLAHQYGTGWAEDIEYDDSNRVRSHRIHGRRVTYNELYDYLTKTLGYEPDYRNYFMAGSKYNEETKRYEIVPANYKRPGQLYIGTGKNNLKIYDMAGDGEGDLLDPQYNHLDSFDKIGKNGYDGVKINDFAQTEEYGNFGHHSIGLYPSGIQKMQFQAIPATNFEGYEDRRGLPGRWLSPEYEAWHRSLVEEALKNGKPIPPHVLEYHKF